MSPPAWWQEPRWRVAGFLACAAALNYADRAALSSVLPALRGDFQLTDVQLGLLGSVFLWAYALGSPLAGAIADRVSRTNLVIGSLIAWSSVTALMGAAGGFATLLGLRLGLGLAECLFLPAAIALIADCHGPGTRARALSFISIGVNGGMVLGGSLAGLLAEHFGWRWSFGVLGGAGLVLALAARPFLPRAIAPAEPASPPAPVPSARATRTEALANLARVPS
jgi:predicted MFS family arabinose efflux permease